ncbi:MAG: alpha/beta hydrolase [Candidatus Acidiferrales bacterium]
MTRGLRVFGVVILSIASAAVCAGSGAAPDHNIPKGGFITTPEGVKIHYLEAGRAKYAGAGVVGHPAPTDATMTKGDVSLEPRYAFNSILFVPGWTMPGWIWEKQLEYFSDDWRVVAMDPRGQGESSKNAADYSPAARARDIKAMIDRLKLARVVLVGWSMGVLDIAAFVDQYGTDSLAGIVLVDGTPGTEGGHMPKGIEDWMASIRADRQTQIASFVRSMFHKPQDEEYLAKLTKASLAMSIDSAEGAMKGYWTSDYWAALGKINKPTLIVCAQGSLLPRYQDMQKRIPRARLEVFEGDGHALFVDDADKFNGLIEDFLFDLKTRAEDGVPR